MNRTVAALVSIIVVLVAALAWTAGRNQGIQVGGSVSETPASTADIRKNEAKPAPDRSATATVSSDTPQTAGSGANAPSSSRGQKSRFFDTKAEATSDAQCNVTINGSLIIGGNCTVEARTDRAVVFSSNDGCTIDIIGHGSNVKAELTAYKNVCPLLDDAAEPMTTMPLGSVSRRGHCWSNSQATICARP